MKAASPVLIMSQRPMTFLGLAPTLLGLVGAAAAIATIPVILLDWLAVMLPVAIATGAVTWLLFWRAMRRDPHFDRRLLKTPAFWRGQRQRTLLAGVRP